MQLSHSFTTLALSVLVLPYTVQVGMTPSTALTSGYEAVTIYPDNPATYIVSHEEMMHWIANTNTELTFVGKPLNPLRVSSPCPQTTTVTYCTVRVGNVCGGSCTVYTGGAACLSTPGTNCLFATRDVRFCGSAGCKGSCGQFSTCDVVLDNRFCFTPHTESITVLEDDELEGLRSIIA